MDGPLLLQLVSCHLICVIAASQQWDSKHIRGKPMKATTAILARGPAPETVSSAGPNQPGSAYLGTNLPRGASVP